MTKARVGRPIGRHIRVIAQLIAERGPLTFLEVRLRTNFYPSGIHNTLNNAVHYGLFERAGKPFRYGIARGARERLGLPPGEYVSPYGIFIPQLEEEPGPHTFWIGGRYPAEHLFLGAA